MRNLARASAAASGPVAPVVVPTAPAAGQRRRAAAKIGPELMFLYVLWFIILCDPQWFLASFLGKTLVQVPTALFGIFLVMVLLQKPRHLFVPLLCFLIYTGINLYWAYNRGYALTPTKQLLLYYVLAIGTFSYVRNFKQALPIIVMMFVYQYIWWDAHGALQGRVTWHPTNTNYDGFGPLMVMGLSTTIYYAMATKKKAQKTLALLVAGGCVIGFVSSFARGAIVSAGAVIGWIWLRLPRKGVATLMIIGVALVVVTSASLLFSNVKRGDARGSFWEEMLTIGAEDDKTATDREVLWDLAQRVFWVHPWMGVGAENFGPFAAEYFETGETGGNYDENPARLYERDVHSSYFQILSEYGVIGSSLFLWLLIDFWLKNRKLRRRERIAAWRDAGNGALDLKQLSLGIEASMVAFLSTAFFYNQVFVHWLYSILTINILLYLLSKPKGLQADGVRRRASRA